MVEDIHGFTETSNRPLSQSKLNIIAHDHKVAKYTQAVVDYFNKTNQPREEDNRKIIQEILLDQQVYGEMFKGPLPAIVTRKRY